MLPSSLSACWLTKCAPQSSRISPCFTPAALRVCSHSLLVSARAQQGQSSPAHQGSRRSQKVKHTSNVDREPRAQTSQSYKEPETFFRSHSEIARKQCALIACRFTGRGVDLGLEPIHSSLLSTRTVQNLECIREVGSAAIELLFYANGLPWLPWSLWLQRCFSKNNFLCPTPPSVGLLLSTLSMGHGPIF